MPRIPSNCPPNFKGRYRVRRGDTFFQIAQIFRVRFEALVVNNPHIPDPNVLFPGDVLCVPARIRIPCCLPMEERIETLPFGTSGAAFVHFDQSGTQAVSFVATLPAPSTLGNFDIYIATVLIPEISGGFGDQLFPTPEDPPTYATTVSFPTAATLSPGSRAVIRPSNSQTGVDGPVILEANLGQCNS